MLRNEESLDEARKILIERILNSKIKREDKIEIAIWIHHIFQPEKYEENRKALQKALHYK